MQSTSRRSGQDPFRIIAVCTGNICRSPMAEYMLAEAFAAAGLGDAVEVDSAGTTDYEAGRPIDPRAARKLASQGLTSDEHVARAWRPDWFGERDLILALDVDHFGWLQESAPSSEAASRVRMLRSFDPKVAAENTLDQGIEDPWYGGHADFDVVWDQIHDAVPGIVEHVQAAVEQRSRSADDLPAGTL